MNNDTALKLFQHTIQTESRVRPDIHAGMLKLADQDVIESASLQVTNALALGERVWMTSDLHFGHKNIIDYCDRPFRDIAAMNEALLAQLGKVGPDELLVIVGDVLMGDYETNIEFVRRIPGRKILAVGNHDFKRDGSCLLRRERDLSGKGPLFEAVVAFLVWTGAQGRAVMTTHYPLRPPGSHQISLPLLPMLNYHGHLHREVLAPTDRVKFMNVGWDVSHGLICI